MPRAYSLDVSIPAHVFGQHPGYRVLVCGDQNLDAVDAIASSDGPSHIDMAADIRPTHSLSDVEYADIVVVPGYENPSLPIPEGYLKAVRLAGDRGARIVAVCTGVFALAASGMLDGKTATTHWQYTDQLRTTYPGVDIAGTDCSSRTGRFSRPRVRARESTHVSTSSKAISERQSPTMWRRTSSSPPPAVRTSRSTWTFRPLLAPAFRRRGYG